ncbi:radical SAM protein [Magnetospira sp. QH-2]|uniref:radical SAM protein n=1 Tax=Magnetospira sp. (strain QH-2) TaxID=1288970 RepID=UPI0003E81700|nr:radical SAM protein [Magnetospira sp. QH-2]CCQ74928.1 conserved protein of unknown function[Include Radical SAM superfamily domain] [Magnetospira sp. QH-2]
MAVLTIPQLEMDISYMCNLRCEGCAHYSNYSLPGSVDFKTGEAWLRRWAERVRPELFGMLGGEPAINPHMLDYVRLVAELWPDTKRLLISNGLLLYKYPDLWQTLVDTGTKLEVSCHSTTDQKYLAQFNPRLAEIEAAREEYGFDFRLRHSENFYKAYRGEGATMKPFDDGDPAASYKVCDNRKCWTLHLGRIWKCPPLAFLGLVADKFDLYQHEEWWPYMQYKGIGLDASDEELEDFFDRRTEWVCGMCPTKLDRQPMNVLPKKIVRDAAE